MNRIITDEYANEFFAIHGKRVQKIGKGKSIWGESAGRVNATLTAFLSRKPTGDRDMSYGRQEANMDAAQDEYEERIEKEALEIFRARFGMRLWHVDELIFDECDGLGTFTEQPEFKAYVDWVNGVFEDCKQEARER